MGTAPFVECGIVSVTPRFSKRGIYKVIGAVKSYAEKSESIRADDIYILEESEWHDSTDHITLTIPLKHEVNSKMDAIFGSHNCGDEDDVIDLYWENFTSKENRKRWNLAIGGRKICGIRYRKILKGDESYDNCLCKDSCKEYWEVCQDITEILKQFAIREK